jgi:hypothetical protein
MSYYVYIIQSDKDGTYYVGSTQDKEHRGGAQVIPQIENERERRRGPKHAVYGWTRTIDSTDPPSLQDKSISFVDWPLPV